MKDQRSYLLISLAAFFAPLVAAKAQDAVAQYERSKRDAIEAVRIFAERICTVTSNSEVRTQVDKLTGKLATMDIDTTKSFSKSAYVGVLQENIEGMARDRPGCIRTIMNEWRDDFLPQPPAPTYNVVIKTNQPFINNAGFGPIDGSISSLKLYIDKKLVIDKYLDEKFSGSVKLQEGNHSFLFEADISAPSNSLATLMGECEGNIEVYSNTTFKPKVVFGLMGMDGVFQDCDLLE